MNNLEMMRFVLLVEENPAVITIMTGQFSLEWKQT
jgi:hypothetical protein